MSRMSQIINPHSDTPVSLAVFVTFAAWQSSKLYNMSEFLITTRHAALVTDIRCRSSPSFAGAACHHVCRVE